MDSAHILLYYTYQSSSNQNVIEFHGVIKEYCKKLRTSKKRPPSLETKTLPYERGMKAYSVAMYFAPSFALTRAV